MAQARKASTKAQVRKRQDRFLLAFSKIGTIARAAVAAKIAKETVRLWRKCDAEFEKRFQSIDLDVTGMLEDSAVDDALGQFDEKTGRYKGGDTITRIFLLKARRPEIYRDNTRLEAELRDKAGNVTIFTLKLGDEGNA